MPQFPLDAHSRHSTVPVAERTPAHLVITPELLAATATSTLAFARSFHRVWFSLLGALCDRKLVTLFDTFVIGPPDPLLLEVAARLQRFNQADAGGEFDEANAEAERQWELEHEDHWEDEEFDGHPPEPPTMVERTYLSMCCSQEFERVRMWTDYDRLVPAELKVGREHFFELFYLSMRAEALLADVAPLVRLGPGMVIDARLGEERRPHRRRAAWAA